MPEDVDTQSARSEIYAAMRRDATSLMAKGIYQAAALEVAAAAGIDPPEMGRNAAPLS